MVSGNFCQICKKKLDGKFHADHIMPYSKGGKTILKNAQALCQNCNLKKGSSNEINSQGLAGKSKN